MKQKFLIRQHCGNIVAMIRDKGVPCMIINDNKVSFGKKNVLQILEMLH